MKLLYLAILATAVNFAAGAARSAPVAVGDSVHLNWRTTTGMTVVNRELRGHLLVVDFWASWCPACMQEAPDVSKAFRIFSSQGVGFLGVSLDEDLPTMQQTSQKIGYVWPEIYSGLGWSDPIVRKWGVNEIPTTFIIGPTGKVLWKGFPFQMAAALKTQLRLHPTQAILAKKAAGLLASATEAVLADHNPIRACRDIDKISPAIQQDSTLRTAVKKLLFAIRRSGLKSAQQLRKDTTAMNRLSAIIGRGNVMMFLGL